MTQAPLNRGRFLAVGLLVVSLCAWSGTARALVGPWAKNDHIRARVVLPASGKTASSRFEAGVDIRVADGWRVPWRQNTKAGQAVQLRWFGHGVKTVDIERPVPKLRSKALKVGLGYENRFTLPVSIQTSKPRSDVMLNARVRVVLCNQSRCINEHVTAPLRVSYQDQAKPDTQTAKRLKALQKRVPHKTQADIGTVKASSTDNGRIREVRFLPEATGWGMANRIRLRHPDVTFGRPHAVEDGRAIAFPVIDGKLKPGVKIEVVRVAGNLSRFATTKVIHDPSFLDRVSQFVSMTGPHFLGLAY